MPLFARRAVLRAILLVGVSLAAAGCAERGIFRPEYEYEEELYLALDGSATLNVNASVAALVALHGAGFDVDPRARIDRDAVRALFTGPGVEQTRVSLSRRDGRRFVHVSVEVDDVRRIPAVAPFAWSTYRFDRRGDVFAYRQVVNEVATRDVGEVGWTGQELVNFKMHLPSEIVFHNTTDIERGNILEWRQPLADRLQGVPLEIEVHLETDTILYSTLLLFGAAVMAAALTFALVIWWVARRGRDQVA